MGSLVAIDIRSWFFKELEINAPTLEVLKGGSTADLVKMKLERMLGLGKTAVDESSKSPLDKTHPLGLNGAELPISLL